MLVVDASVIVKSFIDEPGSTRAELVLTPGQTLLTPAHAFAEVGEVASRKMKSGFVNRDQLSEIMQALERDFRIAPIAPLLLRAIEISLATGASVYDCLYVALAAAENCRLVTADRRLIDKMAGTEFAALLTPLDSFSASP